MLTSLDTEGIKKDQLHVKNIDSVSLYFNNNEYKLLILLI